MKITVFNCIRMKSMFRSQTFLPEEDLFFYDVLHTEYAWGSLCIKCKGLTGLSQHFEIL